MSGGPILTVVGARPNFMKAAPVHRAFERRGVPHGLLHTGQHYDEAMSKVFFQDLGMPRPVADLGVGSGTQAEQTAAAMVGLERHFGTHRPRAVLVVGDVNSTMAGALVAAKMGIFCAHVEAGLRSGDWSMPEEVNRVVTDSVVDLLLTPSPDGDDNLRREGCPAGSIVCVGNVMIDTLLEHLPRARALDMPGRMGLPAGGYAVVTLHRPSNVDDPAQLGPLVEVVAELAARLPVVFPVHPRTRKRATDAGLRLFGRPGLHIVDPLGYLEFLSLSSAARLCLTDSGGLQEETTVLGIPCLTLRENTERPVTISEGTNELCGTDPARIRETMLRTLDHPPARRGPPALWDGHAAERVVDAVLARI